MGNPAQKYRYGGLVIEVRRIGEISQYVFRFECLVRGFGRNNPAPRQSYIVNASTNAAASRKALQNYIDNYGTQKH